jgi:hypothetical protein
MRAVSISLLVLIVAALIAWVWWPSAPIPDPTPNTTALSTEEQKKHDAAVVFTMYLGFLALLELDAQQRWNDRYRRCGPEPYWYPVDRVLQLLQYHVQAIFTALMNLCLHLPSLSSPIEWFAWFNDYTVRDIASVIASPYLAGFQIAVDILADIFLGESVYVSFKEQPMCYVYCDVLNDDICEYI